MEILIFALLMAGCLRFGHYLGCKKFTDNAGDYRRVEHGGTVYKVYVDGNHSQCPVCKEQIYDT